MKVSTSAPVDVKVASALITTQAPQSTPVQRMMAALADPAATFTPDQVAYLMATAARWAREAVEGEPSPLSYAAGFDAGYKARVAEENDQYRRDCETVFFDGDGVIKGIEQRQLRDRLDREALVPRLGDYTGGPVDWDTGRTINPPPLRARPSPAAPLPAGAHPTATTPFSTGSAA